MKSQNTKNSIAKTDTVKNGTAKTNSAGIPVRLAFYIIGFLVLTMGIAVSVKSGMGVTPVSSVPYTATCVFGLEMGRATLILHVIFVAVQILLLRKDFELKNLLQIPAGVIYSAFTTFCNYLLTFYPDPQSIVLKLVMMLLSTFLLALGIFIYVSADFVPLAGEGIIIAIAQASKVKFSTCKIWFDLSMVTLSFTVCMIFIHRPGSVGIGTACGAVLVGTNLKIITRFIGPARDRLLGRNQSDKAMVE